jgi:hypothetical protein
MVEIVLISHLSATLATRTPHSQSLWTRRPLNLTKSHKKRLLRASKVASQLPTYKGHTELLCYWIKHERIELQELLAFFIGISVSGKPGLTRYSKGVCPGDGSRELFTVNTLWETLDILLSFEQAEGFAHQYGQTSMGT